MGKAELDKSVLSPRQVHESVYLFLHHQYQSGFFAEPPTSFMMSYAELPLQDGWKPTGDLAFPVWLGRAIRQTAGVPDAELDATNWGESEESPDWWSGPSLTLEQGFDAMVRYMHYVASEYYDPDGEAVERQSILSRTGWNDATEPARELWRRCVRRVLTDDANGVPLEDRLIHSRPFRDFTNLPPL